MNAFYLTQVWLVHPAPVPLSPLFGSHTYRCVMIVACQVIPSYVPNFSKVFISFLPNFCQLVLPIPMPQCHIIRSETLQLRKTHVPHATHATHNIKIEVTKRT